MMSNFLAIKKIPNKGIPIAEQRRMWLRQFLKAFMVVFLTYMCMYLIRNNFKAAQPMMKEQLGLGALKLGYIGLAFSVTYGLGKTAVGYYIERQKRQEIYFSDADRFRAYCAGNGLALERLWFGYRYFRGVVGLKRRISGRRQPGILFHHFPLGTAHRARPLLGFGICRTILAVRSRACWLYRGANTFFGGNVLGMFIFPALIALVMGWPAFLSAKTTRKSSAGTAAKKFSANRWKPKMRSR